MSARRPALRQARVPVPNPGSADDYYYRDAEETSAQERYSADEKRGVNNVQKKNALR